MMQAVNSDVNQKWKVVLYIQKKQAVMGSWKGYSSSLGARKRQTNTEHKKQVCYLVLHSLEMDSYEWME